MSRMHDCTRLKHFIDSLFFVPDDHGWESLECKKQKKTYSCDNDTSKQEGEYVDVRLLAACNESWLAQSPILLYLN